MLGRRLVLLHSFHRQVLYGDPTHHASLRQSEHQNLPAGERAGIPGRMSCHRTLLAVPGTHPTDRKPVTPCSSLMRGHRRRTRCTH